MMIDKDKLEQRSMTIDILVKELQLKQGRLDKHRDKIHEQQEHLKYKIKRIDELKNEYDELELGLEDKDERIVFLERRLTAAENKIKRFENKTLTILEDEILSMNGKKQLRPANKLPNLKKRKGNGKDRVLENGKWKN